MSDKTDATRDETDNKLTPTAQASSAYKVIGKFSNSSGAGVLGQNDATSGTPVGVKGVVDGSVGYGLDTPDDARIDGDIDATSGHTMTVDGVPTLRLEATKTDSFNSVTAGGNVIAGYEGNGVQNSALGATVSGGGTSGSQDLGGNIGTRDNTNEVTNNYGTVSGGRNNRAGYLGAIGGGQRNTTTGKHGTVAGGKDNKADSMGSVGGGRKNTATALRATVGGGLRNDATANDATVGGGKNNDAKGGISTVAGGNENTTDGFVAAIGGGSWNTTTAENATIAGGLDNRVEGKYGTIAGGGPTKTLSPSERAATRNAVYDDYGTIGGGGKNRVGEANSSGTDNATYATIPGGLDNEASGSYSFAAGRRAKATHNGSFVWADSTDSDVTAQGTDQFLVEAGGGTGIGTEDPVTTMHVKDDVAENGGDNLGRHVAAIENTSTSTDPTPDVLGLELTNETDPTQYNSYVSFMDSTGTIGNIQGNGNGGIEVRSADTLDLKANDTGMVTVDGANNKVTVNGDIEADNKNFVQSVETDDGEKEVVYASTEAPTPRAEASDVAELEDGRAEIELPDHFGWVTDDGEPLHVQTTPYSADSGGLAVVERSTDRLVVEDLDGEGDYEFSYTVKGTREGYTDEEVVREPATDASGDASPTPADD